MHQLRREAGFHVQSADRVVDRGQLGLDLDDEKNPARMVPGEDVDGATLTELREGDFDVDVPARSTEFFGDITNEERVAFIEQSIDLPAPPVDDRLEAGIDSRKRRAKDSDRERGQMSSLDQRNGLLGQSG